MLRWMHVVLLAGLTMAPCFGQISRNLLEGITPPGIASGGAAGSYAVSATENVNLFSGGLNIQVPLRSIRGRGEAGFGLTLAVETRWSISQVTYAAGGSSALYPASSDYPSAYVGYAPGRLERRVETDDEYCGTQIYSVRTRSRFQLRTNGGADIEFVDKLTMGTSQSTGLVCLNGAVTGTPANFVRGAEFVTVDNSNVTFLADGAVSDCYGATCGSETGVLRFKDGTFWRVEAGRITKIVDRNGNRTTFAAGNDAYGRPILITDSMGRTVTIEYGSPPQLSLHANEDHIKYKGYQNGDRSIVVKYAPMAGLLRSGTISKMSALFPGTVGTVSQDYDYNPTKVAEVILPDDRKYEFRYNQYGEVTRFVLPTGGFYEYEWAGFTLEPGGQYGSLMVYRRVTERRVYDRGAVLLGKSSYAAPSIVAGGDLAVTVTEKTPAEAALRTSIHTFHGSPLQMAALSAMGNTGWREGKEYNALVSGVGGEQRTVAQTYMTRNAANNLLITPSGGQEYLVFGIDTRAVKTQTTEGSAVTREELTFSVDAFNNVLKRCVFDGASSTIAVLCQGMDYVTAGTYTGVNVHLRGLPAGQWSARYSSTGVETLDSQTTVAYDVYSGDSGALVDRVGITEQEGWGTGYTVRGNPTSVSRWKAGAMWSTSYAGYDIAGNIVRTAGAEVQKASGLVRPVTLIGYTDSWVGPGAASTSTFAAATSVTNALGQVSSGGYDFQTGLAVSATDANSKTTSMEYNDPFERLRKVTKPDSLGTSLVDYDAVNHKITQYDSLELGREIAAEAQFDGLGRMKRTERTGAGAAKVVSETQYDALGRVWRSSMPAFETPLDWTTTTYDAFDRPLNQTAGDGLAVTRTRYTGRDVVTVDAAGKYMKRTGDAAGRLVSVFQDAAATVDGVVYSGANLLTSYEYDSRGLLTTVVQGDRPNRTFVYDGLGLLGSTSQPESGVTAYVYDPAGNLVTKTDGASRVTSVVYDELSRMVGRTYSDGTPGETFCYDGVTGGSCGLEVATGAKVGRMTMAVNSSGVVRWTSFDALGRVLGMTQNVGGYGDWGSVYGYNHQGLTSLTYPSGRVVNYTTLVQNSTYST